MFRAPAWTPRESYASDDDLSDHHPSPLHPSYNDPSPASAWLSPVTAVDDADMLFDYTQPSVFCSLVDDASQNEQQTLLQRWRTLAPSQNKAAPLSRQPTVDDVLIAGEQEERIVRRFQRKNGLKHLSLREVKRRMAPLEFDPLFVDSDTEDEGDERTFNPENLQDLRKRPRTPHPPSPISIPAPAPFVASAPLSPLTPLSSEPRSLPSSYSAPEQTQLPSPPASPVAAPYVRAASPAIKQEAPEASLSPSRASPAPKRPISDVERETEVTLSGDDALSEAEGDYTPSDDEEDDADSTYGAPKTRRVSTSHAPTHSRSASNTDKPARASAARRRRPMDDAAPSQCTYENPLNGERCPQIFARLPEMKRHIDHFHYEHEARAVIEGRLPRQHAKLLGSSWDGTLGKPTCEGCGTEFSRRDAVKRHQNEVKATFENGRCVWCPGTQGRKGSAKRVAAAKLTSGPLSKRQRRK